ncbi:hypothetical protein [Lederbergia citri]|uniref:Uncharacterized protein n=1 Tax=Lederbergia citri TaxID=2833580 RepID=A0A942YG61_9BACI|nr:hypothetical protein [Lederbergia citri]MBS4194344.1 hypothetical protein [Lederbergia citri]
MKRAAILTMAVMLLGACNDGSNRWNFSCTVHELEEYGFAQLSDYQEYVCVNVNGDKTDFIVIEDEEEKYQLGDRLKVFLNHDDILKIKLMK